jgi:penicillin-binding protein 1A
MTSRARRLNRRSQGSPGKKILLGLAVLVGLIALGIGGVGVWVFDVRASAPSIDDLKPIDQGESSAVFAADGSLLGYIDSDSIRDEVRLKQIPKSLQDATVAIEDEKFYEHNGVDYEAIIRAALENLEAGKVKQGGSTITQQLARNLYIDDPEDNIQRKIVEAKLAEQMEEQHDKDWILEQYLNTASYGTNQGRTAVGVEAASQIYFDKPVDELNLWEAALLAGLPQAPSEYNPFSSQKSALDRRNQVLRAMLKNGFISRASFDNAVGRGLGLEPGDKFTEIRQPELFSYFFSYVEQELIAEYGVNTVRQGGLEVHTTINPRLQEVATTAARNGATSLGGPSSALVSTDASNGHIVAMASSGDFNANKYNLAAQGHRQPGSSFKPFVLATAVDQGIDPDSTYYSGASPTTLSMGRYSEPWIVNNAGDTSGGGTMDLRSATTGSVNVVYAQLGLDVGPEDFADMANALGVEAPLNGYPAEAIGGLEVGVSPLDMSNAYATFANGGVHHDQTAIARVEFPNGDVDQPKQPEGNRVLTEGEAYTVTDILEGVVTGGTGTAASYGCPAAGKTGTTDENTDAWFVGYTPNLSTAVWTGYPDARTSMGSSAFGGTYSAPIWNEFMSVADPSCDSFKVPSELPDLSGFTGGHATSKPAPPPPIPKTDTDDRKSNKSGPNGPGDAYAPGRQDDGGNDGNQGQGND